MTTQAGYYLTPPGEASLGRADWRGLAVPGPDFASGYADGYADGFADGVASVAPVGGDVVSISQTPLSRWTPVTAQISMTGGDLYAFYASGTNRFVVRDAAGFSPLFAERSSFSSGVATILPNGGWWEPFTLTYVAGVEMT